MTCTWTDNFCGAGGTTEGASQVADVEIRVAANHWPLAIETHNRNHQRTEHICADLSQVDPRLFPRTTAAWFSPSCTWQTTANSKRNQLLHSSDPNLRAEAEAAERSRATMWDVVRFSEFHRYRMVLVENVVEAGRLWEPYRAWLTAMESLGYEYQVLSFNSAHAQMLGDPPPQSRDRAYWAFSRRGDRRPNFSPAMRPKAYCPHCDLIVESTQSWKKDPEALPGKYRAQYVYACSSCGTTVEPGWMPAASILNLDNPGQRIGDRDRPLATNTMQRIQAGMNRWWGPGAPEPVLNAFLAHSKGTSPSQIAASNSAVTDPIHTIAAGGNHHALVSTYYGTGTNIAGVDEALRTLTTRDRHALIMRNNTGGAEMTTPADQTARTVTTAGHQSLLHRDSARRLPDINDVHYRMIDTIEGQRAMGFRDDYVVLGTKAQKMRMIGNAVTPPVSRDLISISTQTLAA